MGALPPAVLGFDQATGIAGVEFHASDAVSALEASLRLITSFGPSLRAAVWLISGTSQICGSVRALERASQAVRLLHAVGVPVVCSTEGEVAGISVAVSSAAEYRVGGQSTELGAGRCGLSSK